MSTGPAGATRGIQRRIRPRRVGPGIGRLRRVSQQPSTPVPQPLRPYLDPAPLDPQWPAPRRSRSQSRVGTVVLLGLALILLVAGTVWAAGGLAERDDQYASIAPGTPFDLGPVRITLTHVEMVSPANRGSFSADRGWLVTAYGTVENTIYRPVLLSPQQARTFTRTAAGSAGVTVVGEVDRLSTQTEVELLDTTGIPPALGPVSLEVIADYPADWEPTDQVYVAFPTYRVGRDTVIPSDHEYVGSWLPAKIVPGD